MLPCTASTSAGQLFSDGSFTLQRAMRLSGSGADPIEDFAAPPFDDAQSAAIRRQRRQRRAVQPGIQILDAACVMRPKRVAHFIDTHLHATQNIALLIDRHFDVQRAVGRVGMIAADVEILARSASGDTDNTEVARLFGVQDSGVLQPVSRGIGGFDHANRDCRTPLKAPSATRRLRDSSAIQVRRTPPGQTTPRSSRLPVNSSLRRGCASRSRRGVGVRDHESDIGGDRADIGNVVVDPLQFEQNACA